MNERPEDLRPDAGEVLTASSPDVRTKETTPAKSRKTTLRRPQLTSAAIGRLLLRQAQGPLPEKRLVVAVITLAFSDVFSPKEDIRRSALAFLEGPGLDHWASQVGLDGVFVRELARKGGYLPTPEPISNESNPSEHAEVNDAGLQ